MRWGGSLAKPTFGVIEAYRFADGRGSECEHWGTVPLIEYGCRHGQQDNAHNPLHIPPPKRGVYEGSGKALFCTILPTLRRWITLN